MSLPALPRIPPDPPGVRRVGVPLAAAIYDRAHVPVTPMCRRGGVVPPLPLSTTPLTNLHEITGAWCHIHPFFVDGTCPCVIWVTKAKRLGIDTYTIWQIPISRSTSDRWPGATFRLLALPAARPSQVPSPPV